MKNGFFSFLLFFLSYHAIDAQNQRVFVLTDIENELDDAMSYVHFLTYANHFDIEGIVATTSCWQRTKTMHFILEVTDKGTHGITRYQRVIVNVIP